jgi:hypothetical protein
VGLFSCSAGLFLLTIFTFCYFFTTCNFHKLLFTVEKGQSLYCIHCARGELERVHLDFFSFFFFYYWGGGGWRLMFFFPLDIWKGGRRMGERGTFFFWKCFFHCGEAREGKGVIFFTNSLWDKGKGASWFFFLFLLLRGRGVEVNVFFFLHLTCGRRKGKGWFFIFYLILFFHCGVARDRG